MKISIRSVIPFVLLIVCSCSRHPHDVDISGIQVPEIAVQRLDQDLFALNSANISEKTEALSEKYGPYFDHYIMGFIARKGTQDSAYREQVLSFVQDRDVRLCQRYVQALYSDEALEDIAAKAEECAKRFRYHFKEEPLPNRLVTCLSGWNYACAYMDSALVLSLDMYLGDTTIFYEMLQYPQYQQRRMKPEYILPDLARGWLITAFDNAPAENTLLDHSIFYGKLFYAVNALLPYTHDSLLIGYTGKELDYCEQYEKKLWSYFAEKNRLFESDMNTIRELTSEGPFTAAISKDCPPRIAMWVGWQIVKSYMSNNEHATLAELMREHDARKILNKSRYRP